MLMSNATYATCTSSLSGGLSASKINLRRNVIGSNLRTIAIFGVFRMPLVREVSAHYTLFMDMNWMYVYAKWQGGAWGAATHM